MAAIVFLLYREAKTGKLHGLNGSGRAPARATLEEFERRGLMQVPEFGILSTIVPGAVDAWQTALERFGTRSLEELLQPAIAFAEDGYAVTPVVAKAWHNNAAVLAPHAESRRDFLVDGRAPMAGTVHRQPRLAQSLRQLARGGREAFYRGAIAEEIVRFSRAHDGLSSLRISLAIAPNGSSRSAPITAACACMKSAERPGHHRVDDAQYPGAGGPARHGALKRRASASAYRGLQAGHGRAR